jgi:hypothetical protein
MFLTQAQRGEAIGIFGNNVHVNDRAPNGGGFVLAPPEASGAAQ